MSVASRLFLVLILAVFAGCKAEQDIVLAQRDTSPFLADVESWTMTSAIAGREFQISVAIPYGYANSNVSYPVLYALDANGQFGIVVETTRILGIDHNIPPIVVVGIGFPTGGRQILSEGRRFYDYTPSSSTEIVELRNRLLPSFPAAKGSGGASTFLDFIRTELIPLIEDRYRVDTSHRAIYGHSLGGLFGLFALIEGDGTFDQFIIGSPSLWWDERHLFDLESRYASEHDVLEARLFLAVGMDELDGEYFEGIGPGRVVSDVRELAQALASRDYTGLEMQTVFFESENHQSVLPGTVSRGLRYIFGDR